MINTGVTIPTTHPTTTLFFWERPELDLLLLLLLLSLVGVADDEEVEEDSCVWVVTWPFEVNTLVTVTTAVDLAASLVEDVVSEEEVSVVDEDVWVVEDGEVEEGDEDGVFDEVDDCVVVGSLFEEEGWADDDDGWSVVVDEDVLVGEVEELVVELLVLVELDELVVGLAIEEDGVDDENPVLPKLDELVAAEDVKDDPGPLFEFKLEEEAVLDKEVESPPPTAADDDEVENPFWPLLLLLLPPLLLPLLLFAWDATKEANTRVRICFCRSICIQQKAMKRFFSL